jgi:hypothetical protein
MEGQEAPTEELAVTPADLEAIEKATMYADFSDLSQEQRMFYIRNLCDDMKLDIRRSPFQWIVLQNKLVPYAKKACTDQLRDVHDVSIQITDQKIVSGIYTVQVRAQKPSGRTDEDIGTALVEGVVGDSLGNAMKRAVTQAKRRVTLSICGLGMLDESEIAQIPDEAKREAPPGPKRVVPPPVRATLPSPPPVITGVDPAAGKEVVQTSVASPEQLPQPKPVQQAQPVPMAGSVPLGNVKPAKLPPAAAPIRVPTSGIPKAKE